MSEPTAPKAPLQRNATLDEIRGYAIFGMLLVNFFGHYKTDWIDALQASPSVKYWLTWIFGIQLEHHSEYMTYADTIAPLFMFVVGLGMRLSWLRRVEKVSPGEARRDLAKRYVTLLCIAFIIYTGYLWDALMNISLAGLLAVLIVDKKPAVRIAYAVALVVGYQLIFSNSNFGEWLLRLGSFEKNLDYPFLTTFMPLREPLLSCAINGGLFGHWSWAMMLICGTIAYDIMATGDRTKIITQLLAWSLVLGVAGWTVRGVGSKQFFAKAEPYAAECIEKGDFKTARTMFDKSPGIFAGLVKGNEAAEKALAAHDPEALQKALPEQIKALAAQSSGPVRLANEWVFSKNYMTAPFPLWASSLCFLHLLFFYLLRGVLGIGLPTLTVVGMNALFIYIFQSLTLEVYSQIQDLCDLQHTTSGWIVLGSFVIYYFGLIYGIARYFYSRKIVIKLG